MEEISCRQIQYPDDPSLALKFIAFFNEQTTYAQQAHHKPKELYVQVADEVDHCFWGRPEDINYKRKAYRVTCQNPGSQPGAFVNGWGRWCLRTVVDLLSFIVLALT